jgi:hypothetical protein
MEPLGTRHVRGLEPRARQRLSRRRRAPGPLRTAGDMVGVGERRRRDFHTSTCRGLFAEGSMTSERAAS